MTSWPSVRSGGAGDSVTFPRTLRTIITHRATLSQRTPVRRSSPASGTCGTRAAADGLRVITTPRRYSSGSDRDFAAPRAGGIRPSLSPCAPRRRRSRVARPIASALRAPAPSRPFPAHRFRRGCCRGRTTVGGLVRRPTLVFSCFRRCPSARRDSRSSPSARLVASGTRACAFASLRFVAAVISRKIPRLKTTRVPCSCGATSLDSTRPSKSRKKNT